MSFEDVYHCNFWNKSGLSCVHSEQWDFLFTCHSRCLEDIRHARNVSKYVIRRKLENKPILTVHIRECLCMWAYRHYFSWITHKYTWTVYEKNSFKNSLCRPLNICKHIHLHTYIRTPLISGENMHLKWCLIFMKVAEIKKHFSHHVNLLCKKSNHSGPKWNIKAGFGRSEVSYRLH